MSNPAVHKTTANDSKNGVTANVPCIPTHAPMGESANARPRMKWDKWVNLFVYEYPKMMSMARGDIYKASRLSNHAQRMKSVAHRMVNIHRLVLPIFFLEGDAIGCSRIIDVVMCID